MNTCIDLVVDALVGQFEATAVTEHVRRAGTQPLSGPGEHLAIASTLQNEHIGAIRKLMLQGTRWPTGAHQGLTLRRISRL